jgi:hypothetical protein
MYHNRWLNAELLQSSACLRQATGAFEEVFHASFFDLLYLDSFAVRRYCPGTGGPAVFRNRDSDPGWSFD